MKTTGRKSDFEREEDRGCLIEIGWFLLYMLGVIILGLILKWKGSLVWPALIYPFIRYIWFKLCEYNDKDK